jgi:hypothetical protein
MGKRGPAAKPVAERFWPKVDVRGPDECWVWTAAKYYNGYGVFRVSGHNTTAHRMAYELTYGQSPGALHVDHTCFTHSCCNPKHLRLATNKQNMENRSGVQRNNTSSGVRGVTRSRCGRWQAQVQHNKKVIYLGTFDSIEEAGEVARVARLNLFSHNDSDMLLIT